MVSQWLWSQNWGFLISWVSKETMSSWFVYDGRTNWYVELRRLESYDFISSVPSHYPPTEEHLRYKRWAHAVLNQWREHNIYSGCYVQITVQYMHMYHYHFEQMVFINPNVCLKTGGLVLDNIHPKVNDFFLINTTIVLSHYFPEILACLLESCQSSTAIVFSNNMITSSIEKTLSFAETLRTIIPPFKEHPLLKLSLAYEKGTTVINRR